ncbi:sugar phosphate nucleotidyltransferase [Stigmatella aurantiaca]|uniref:1-epi-valienol-1, 7-bisphosphate-1-adenylyltransferase GacR n=2 Tax=Stigmatella aurantiaca (strain DW4/3-1) TaxID=378806 RepID=E3FTY1_STIAD|nr:sugar phosphate nucleotidyltransferase [Stigmatella aurantiaca]ADO70933.1 1-epi-valienol-1,7-bisphosphate-1-adenylyltransferase GacR [Stigmatella aurantiaca DW4/3-1]
MEHVRAVLLAGGRGVRMGRLGQGRLKPLVPFGGQCHLIDFSLLNCRASGIEEVLLLSQHNEAQLIHYLLAHWHGQGLKIHFGPYQGITPETCEHVLATVHRPAEAGTGDALRLNAPYLFGNGVRDVLVLHADHVYRFDYRPMLALHRERRAVLTLGYQRIAREAVSLFGMVELGAEDRLLRFVEKPEQPTADTVFTAVAIFSAEPLQQYLETLSRGPWQADISRDVIPAMIQAGERIFGYRFEAYWEDIGTSARYLEAHRRLVSDRPTLSLAQLPHTLQSTSARHWVRHAGGLRHTLTGDDVRCEGRAERSVLFPGVVIGPRAAVRDSVVLPGAHILGDSQVEGSIVLDGEHLRDAHLRDRTE